MAWRGRSRCSSAAHSSAVSGGATSARFGLPAFCTSSRWIATILRMLSIANSSAAIRSASGISRVPPSTMMMLSAVPATTMSMSLPSSCSKVGSTTNWPSTRPTRTAPIGSGNGMSERLIAAEAPIRASTSASFSWSEDITVAMIWVSYGNCLLNSGRMGRSI